jgi:MoxR-like ATPase
MRSKWIGQDQALSETQLMLELGQHLLLEGPVGVGKTTLVHEVAARMNRPVIRVDGDGRYTEQKLVGWFDPPMLLKKGYVAEAFQAGPLLEAMQSGQILFVNELNRMPEGVQNVLLSAMDEGRVQLPHLGERAAKKGFVVVATQNPKEYVATAPLSEGLRDRLNRLSLSYPPREDESQILRSVTEGLTDDVFGQIVQVVRGSRFHPRLRRGASIRAGIACAELLAAKPSLTLERVAELTLAHRIELRESADMDNPTSESEQLRDVIADLLARDWELSPDESDSKKKS